VVQYLEERSLGEFGSVKSTSEQLILGLKQFLTDMCNKNKGFADKSSVKDSIKFCISRT
jgi:hypothetical protein